MYQYILVAIPPLDLFFNIKDIVNESFRIPDKFTLTLSYQAILLSSKDEHIPPIEVREIIPSAFTSNSLSFTTSRSNILKKYLSRIYLKIKIKGRFQQIVDKYLFCVTVKHVHLDLNKSQDKIDHGYSKQNILGRIIEIRIGRIIKFLNYQCF